MAAPFKRRDVVGIIVIALLLLVAVAVPALGRAKAAWRCASRRSP